MSRPSEAELIKAGAPVMYDPEQAGPIVGHTANWMKIKARKNLIPCTRVGRKIMFTPQDLADLAAMGRQRPQMAAATSRAANRKGEAADAAKPRLQARPPKRRAAA